MSDGLDIVFFGSSLVSAYWNGAATYYRGIIRQLNARGHRVTFYEPNAWDRQAHRDIEDPSWARVVVYSSQNTDELYQCLEQARNADIIVKTSGVGIFDELLEKAVLAYRRPDSLVIFWDVDAPATLERVRADTDDYFRQLIGKYDMILTYGGGEPVTNAYMALGAKQCTPIYNALDPSTHYPVAHQPQFVCRCSFLGNRLPDREARVDEFLFKAARSLKEHSFMLGGNGWHDKDMPANVKYLGHVYTKDHNSLNSSSFAVLNISRESMASYGYSPATRVFEAAGAAACIISDQWAGLDYFFEPGREILAARNGQDVTKYLAELTCEQAEKIGTAALRRVLAEHTYAHRASLLESALGLPTRSRTYV